MYRPGDTVHLRGLVRTAKLGEGLSVPRERAVEVTVRDPRGQTVFSDTVELSRFGGWHLDIETDEASSLGDFNVEAKLPEHRSFHASFAVEEYRPATFEVKVAADREAVYTEDNLQLKADGRYFFGAPVRAADINWRVHSRPRSVYFSEYPAFNFGDDENHYGWAYGQESFFTEEDGKLDDEGFAVLDIPVPRDAFTSPSTVMVSASVSDETNQSRIPSP